MSKKEEYSDKYIKEEIPKKPYTVKPKYNFRKRRKNELFWNEIIIGLIIIAMLIMLIVNYQNQMNYQAQIEEQERQVNVGVGIEEESDFRVSELEKNLFLIDTRFKFSLSLL